MRATILSGGCGNLYWGEATSRNWFTWELTLKNNRREQTALIKRMSCIIQGGCRLPFSVNIWIHQIFVSIFMNSELLIQSKGSRTSKHQWDHSFDHIHFISKQKLDLDKSLEYKIYHQENYFTHEKPKDLEYQQRGFLSIFLGKCLKLVTAECHKLEVLISTLYIQCVFFMVPPDQETNIALVDQNVTCHNFIINLGQKPGKTLVLECTHPSSIN
jgi:hypothetical protein